VVELASTEQGIPWTTPIIIFLIEKVRKQVKSQLKSLDRLYIVDQQLDFSGLPDEWRDPWLPGIPPGSTTETCTIDLFLIFALLHETISDQSFTLHCIGHILRNVVLWLLI